MDKECWLIFVDIQQNLDICCNNGLYFKENSLNDRYLGYSRNN